MAGSETRIPQTLEDAVAELMRDPSEPLRLSVNDVEVEMSWLEIPGRHRAFFRGSDGASGGRPRRRNRPAGDVCRRARE